MEAFIFHAYILRPARGRPILSGYGWQAI